MSQANEALAADTEVEKTEEQQQPEPKGLMETQPRTEEDVSQETNEPAPHLEQAPTEDNDDEGPYERPDWFPDKFWEDDGPDLEKMAASYNELEKKFHKGDHKTPEKYDKSIVEKAGIPDDDPLVSFFDDWAKKNGLTQSAYDEITNQFLSQAQGQQESIDLDVKQQKALLGTNADEIIKGNIGWSDSLLRKGIISEEERDEIDIWGGTAIGQKLLIKMRNLAGDSITIPTRTETPELPESEDDFKAETSKMMKDTRYGTDPAYTKSVEKRFYERYK